MNCNAATMNQNDTFTGHSSLSREEFHQFSQFIFRSAGIHLSDAKYTLVSSRLSKRVRARGCPSFQRYFDLLQQDTDERQAAIDLLTTNETYFFRETKHFDFLKNHIVPQRAASREFRVWSAASSSGEEAYSTAMVLADTFKNDNWTVFGSDICTKVIERARRAVYPLLRTELIPDGYLRRFCLKGVGEHDGFFAVEPALRKHVSFDHVNLMKSNPDLGLFDLIMLRNVMIYFQTQTKQQVINHIVERLQPGGYLFIGHSESLFGVTHSLQSVAPAIYRKPL